MERMPSLTSCVKRLADSLLALRRVPLTSSISGGFQKTKSLPPLGEPSSPHSKGSRPDFAHVPRGYRWWLKQDKLRVGAVRLAQAAEPAQDERHIRAENAAVGVGFIDHDEPQIPPQPRPRGVVGQHADVQHVRVGYYKSGFTANQRLARSPACLHQRYRIHRA